MTEDFEMILDYEEKYHKLKEKYQKHKFRNSVAGLVFYLISSAVTHMGVSNAIHKPIEVRSSFIKGAISMGLWPEYEAYSKAGIKDAFLKGIWNLNILPMCEAYEKGGMKHPFLKLISSFGIWPNAEAASRNGVTDPAWKSLATKTVWANVEAYSKLETIQQLKEEGVLNPKETIKEYNK
jgi:hypothetical protein